MSEEEIATELKNQGVTSVKRFTRKDGDSFVKTNTYLFTFALAKLPSSIKAGYFNIGVDVYIPNPLRCFKCQQFGHGAKSCRNSPVCSRCSHSHDSTDCTDAIKCANCNSAHMSSFKSCPCYVRPTKILKIKYNNDISFTDAKKLLDQESPTSSSRLNYSAAVSSSPLKVDASCQTAINWVSDEQTILFPVNADKTTVSSSTASQTTEPRPRSAPEPEPEPETITEMLHNVSMTRKGKKQQKKKESKALKHSEVPLPLTVPLEVHNPFEPLDMEVTPSPPIQQRGSSSRSRSPVEPP
ncbi:uncharacterized protein LOC124151837 [Haliotis rufescens]|uniref:uncharacterized protein LOC124151837 n=1 Tax=Haliotis rufescens TaxID=6454 RepID=UPI00201EDF39|nr:uncharacterized protein LOC124151837 [Haliotis rufescens]